MRSFAGVDGLFGRHPAGRLRATRDRRGGAEIDSGLAGLTSRENRALLVVVVAVVTVGLVVADFTTWIELDVAAIYGLPLVLAGATRSRALVWTLTGFLVVTTFVVYMLQIPSGTFALNEIFFVNRVLHAVSLLLLAGLLHIWIKSAETREAQARVIREQDEAVQAGRVARRIVEVQEAERREVANRLHDLVGQKLTALSISLSIVKSQLSPSEAALNGARIDDSLKVVEETTDSIRDVMAELRPAVLEDFGLAPVLRWYAEQFTARTGVVTSVVEEGPVRRLPPKEEHALFRMAQNALANVAKHARADKALITLRTTHDSTCMTVADNGIGFDPKRVREPAKDHGWGLMIMRERAAASGAQLSIQSAPGEGTRVTVTLRRNAHDPSSAGG